MVLIEVSLPLNSVFCTLFFCNTFSISNITSFLKTSSPSCSKQVTAPSFPCGPLKKTYGNTYFKVILIICVSASFFSTCWLTPGGQRIQCTWPYVSVYRRIPVTSNVLFMLLNESLYFSSRFAIILLRIQL